MKSSGFFIQINLTEFNYFVVAGGHHRGYTFTDVYTYSECSSD
jgi:hypothetical protein